MKMTKKNVGDIIVISLFGMFTVEEAMKFKEKRESFIAERNNKFIINMEEVDFISSIGARELLTLAKVAGELGGGLRISTVKPPVETALNNMGLLKIFKIYPTEQEAINSF